ncbi:Phage protein D [Geodermatophilus obscurus]|uniref:Phage protein D n=1 Tax=Geodermatophilus obscurus TaxID=1861 RepID=A0A1M7S3I4_9ACTN|nr:hypothetical protein [Geodermatophilus obscurus]SHN53010.1 Phage protein D [Geodermatophilus obscurus]
MNWLGDVLGIRLLLLLGSPAPLPPPLRVLEALTDVEVTNDVDGPGGFQLSFTLGRGPTLDYELLTLPALQPPARVVLAVVPGAVPQALVNGVVTHHQVQVSDVPRASLLTVTGRDLTALMDLDERNEPCPNQSDSVIVQSALARYARYGIVPAVTPTADVPLEVRRVPHQRETDLALCRRLATANGFVFTVDPVAPGVSRAYWGPETRVSPPQPALTVGAGVAANATLGTSLDALAAQAPRGSFVDPVLKQVWPLPELPSLRQPPLAARSVPVLRTRLLRDTARADPLTAALRAVAAATDTPEAVTATGEADGIRYGHVLRVRGLVGVRGAGLSYDGIWFVRRVTHRLHRNSWTQSFRLSREGLGALTPVVTP